MKANARPPAQRRPGMAALGRAIALACLRADGHPGRHSAPLALLRRRGCIEVKGAMATLPEAFGLSSCQKRQRSVSAVAGRQGAPCVVSGEAHRSRTCSLLINRW
jgi:hypothetical protein